MIAREWQDARRILAVRLDNLGDVLVTTPALHAIKASLPHAELTLMASPVGAQAGALNPDVDDVIVYDAPWMDPWQRLPRDSEREQAMIAQVRARCFDGAIIFTSFRESSLPAAYLCYLADIPLRLAASIDGPGSLLTTRHKHPDRPMHEVERGLDLVSGIGLGTGERDLVLRVPECARKRLMGAIGDGSWVMGDGTGVGSSPSPITYHPSPLIVIHPGCSMPARTYPWELYAELADRLVAQLGPRVVLTGTEDERELVTRIAGRLAPQTRAATLPLAGELPFPDFCALIEAADLTITNNTGPMHIAAAVKTPVVALFALTNPPEQWGPWQVPHRLLYRDVPCRLCYHRICPTQQECLRRVPLDEIVGAAAELLGRSATRRVGVGVDDPVNGRTGEGAINLVPTNGIQRRVRERGVGIALPLAPVPNDEGRAVSAPTKASISSAPLPALQPPDPTAQWLAARNILAVRLDNAGDVVMLGPAVRAIKETSPEATLTLLASPAGSAVAPLLPWVDETIVWRSIWQDLGHLPFDPARECGLVALLAKRGFDAAVIFSSFSQTPHVPAYVCYLAGIPLRAGESKEFGGATLTTELRGAPDDLHQVERSLRLVEHLGFTAHDRRLAVEPGELARAAAARQLLMAGLDPEAPYILLHPGASASARRYPAARFGGVARDLAERGWAVLVVGGTRDADLVEAVTRTAPAARPLARATTLPELAALVERAALVICNNTLPMHLADALGTPAVVLFAGTDLEQAWGPRSIPARLLRRPTSCRPCFRFTCPIGQPCLDIPPEEVVVAALELLPATASTPRIATPLAPLATGGIG